MESVHRVKGSPGQRGRQAGRPQSGRGPPACWSSPGAPGRARPAQAPHAKVTIVSGNLMFSSATPGERPALARRTGVAPRRRLTTVPGPRFPGPRFPGPGVPGPRVPGPRVPEPPGGDAIVAGLSGPGTRGAAPGRGPHSAQRPAAVPGPPGGPLPRGPAAGPGHPGRGPERQADRSQRARHRREGCGEPGSSRPGPGRDVHPRAPAAGARAGRWRRRGPTGSPRRPSIPAASAPSWPAAIPHAAALAAPSPPPRRWARARRSAWACPS